MLNATMKKDFLCFGVVILWLPTKFHSSFCSLNFFAFKSLSVCVFLIRISYKSSHTRSTRFLRSQFHFVFYVTHQIKMNRSLKLDNFSLDSYSFVVKIVMHLYSVYGECTVMLSVHAASSTEMMQWKRIIQR